MIVHDAMGSVENDTARHLVARHAGLPSVSKIRSKFKCKAVVCVIFLRNPTQAQASSVRVDEPGCPEMERNEEQVPDLEPRRSCVQKLKRNRMYA